MGPFGVKPCPLASLEVTVRREPVPTEPAIQVKVKATKLDAPRKGWTTGELGSSETAVTIRRLYKGTYRITAEPQSPADGWCFEGKPPVEVKVLPTTQAHLEVKLQPLTLTVTPDKEWKQLVNLELTPEAKGAGCTLVPPDLQKIRAQAALAAAKRSGNKEWIALAEKVLAAAAAKAMDPKQMGRVLEVEARLQQPIAGVPVYFAFDATGNPPWPGAADDARAALSTRKIKGEEQWVLHPGATEARTGKDGVARTSLRLSRFGGDKFKVLASLKPDPLHNGKAKSTPEIAVWRRIWYQPTYHKDYPLYSLERATSELARCFIQLEQIDPRPFDAGGPGATAQEAWKFDGGPRTGRLDKGQTAVVEVVAKDESGAPKSARVDFVQVGGATRARAVKVGKSVGMDAPGGDVTLDAREQGAVFAAREGVFTVKNEGIAPLDFTAACTQPWLLLEATAGRIPGFGQREVRFRLDEDAVSVLAPGAYEDTVTFSGAGVTRTHKVKFQVQAPARGALVVSPATGLTALQPSTGTKAASWTVTNAGTQPLELSLNDPAQPWLAVACPVIDQPKAEAERLKQQAAEAETRAAAAEREAPVLARLAEEEKKKAAKAADQAEEATRGASEEAAKARRELAHEGDPKKRPALQERVKQANLKFENVRAEGRKAKEEADRRARKAKEDADAKAGEATTARQAAVQLKASADAAAQRAQRRRATLQSGASTTVTATVDPTKAPSPLPPPVALELKDETGGRVERRSVRLAKAPLEVAGADVAVTKHAGTPGGTQGTFTLTNHGTAAAGFTVRTSQPWLVPEVAAGTVAAGASKALTVTVQSSLADAFEPKEYAARVTITDAAGRSLAEKGFTLTVDENPDGALAVTPADDFTAAPGGDGWPRSRKYTLKNVGGQKLEWRITPSETWVAVSTPGAVVAIGDHNKEKLWGLRQAPERQRPQTVQLLITRAQCDPCDAAAITREVDALPATFPGALVVFDGDEVGVHQPALDGKPVVKAGTWSWDGHTGALDSSLIKVERGRASEGEFVLAAPVCKKGSCEKPGCGGGVTAAPTATNKLRVAGLELHGHRGFLGEGGYENRPTCLIVAKENEVDDFNDTVAHELAHMMMGVIHAEAHHRQKVETARTWLAQTNAALKKKPLDLKLHKEKRADEERLDRRDKNHAHFWPPGVQPHPKEYDEGQGNHCGAGGTQYNSPSSHNHKGYRDGTCILFASGRPQPLSWCPDCVKMLKFVDLRRFAYSE